jgi:hypothetical protein
VFNTAAEKEAARGDVERQFSEIRANREAQYASDITALENAFHKDIQDNEQARRDALVAAGFGPDGSDPPVAPAA